MKTKELFTFALTLIFWTALITLICITFSGCTVTRYEGFSRYTLGTKTIIPGLDVEKRGTNVTIHLRGYSSDSVEAFRAGVEAGKAIATGVVK